MNPIYLAIIGFTTNGFTAFITNAFARKKVTAEEGKLVSETYTTLVKDLQKQIEIMKASIDELRKENSDMAVKITSMSIKIQRLEIENKHLKKEK